MRPANRRPVISCHTLDELPAFLKARGVDVRPFLESARINPETVEKPYGFISFASTAKLFEELAQRIPDELFGFHFGKMRRHGRFTLLHFVAAAAPTLKDALETRTQLNRLITNEVEFTFDIEDTGVRCGWRIRSSGVMTRQLEYFFATLVVERARVISRNDAWAPRKAQFRHSPPTELAEFSECFGPNLLFDAPMTSVYFDADVLATELPGANPRLYEELKQIAQNMPLAPELAPSTVEKVQQHLTLSLSDATPSLSRVAEEVGVSVRTLQRDLSDSGTSFAALLDDVRKQAAHEYLTNTSLPITKIAFLVGFSEISTFSRSAKRWFGEPPSAVRKRAG